jgi:Na+/proline symporter
MTSYDAGSSPAGSPSDPNTPDHDASGARPYQQVAADLGVDRRTVQAREEERFGGMKFGSAFFGWLAAAGVAAILMSLLAATGVALSLASDTTTDDITQQASQATGAARTVGLVGGIALLVVLFIAYFCGGYVAGRMARFNGTKQGLAVWIWGIIVAVVVAILVAVFGSQYNVLSTLNLPRIPLDEGSITTAGIIAIAAIIVVTLVAALLGGKAGMHFHRKVDRAGLGD